MSFVFSASDQSAYIANGVITARTHLHAKIRLAHSPIKFTRYSLADVKYCVLDARRVITNDRWATMKRGTYITRRARTQISYKHVRMRVYARVAFNCLYASLRGRSNLSQVDAGKTRQLINHSTDAKRYLAKRNETKRAREPLRSVCSLKRRICRPDKCDRAKKRGVR